jgi:hypothetical protein
LSFSSASSNTPRPLSRIASTTNCMRPRGANTVTRPDTITRSPSPSRWRARTDAVRYITHSMSASSRSSFNVKYTWPLPARCNPLTSPRTRTELVAPSISCLSTRSKPATVNTSGSLALAGRWPSLIPGKSI